MKGTSVSDLIRTLVDSLGKRPDYLVVVVIVAITMFTVYEVTRLVVGGH